MPTYKLLPQDKDFNKFIKQKPIDMLKFKDPNYFNDLDSYFDNYFVYEVTVSFNQSYWSLMKATSSGIYMILDLLVKKLQKFGGRWRIDYVVEYQKNSYPHLHAQIFTEEDIEPDKQRLLYGTLNSRFGRTQWYQTEKHDFYHVEINKETGEPKGKWSEYIRKDLETNNKSGCIHGYTIESN